MKTVSTLLLTVLLSCFGFAGEPCKAGEAAARRSNGQLGARCDSIKTKTEEGGYNGCTVLSPSRAWAVCEKEDQITRRDTLITHIYLEQGKKWIQLAAYDDLGPSWQPIWSPDSSKFAFPYTTGGAACCWDIDIFDVRTKRHHAIAAAAQRDMAKRLKCEFSNVYFAKWQDASSVIIWLEGREPNTNRFSCRDGEHDRAYRVDVRSGKILERYGWKETKRIEESEYQ
jgi:hypothetical protein